jgi:5-methylcytosine-specific restriction endonuclease McrA
MSCPVCNAPVVKIVDNGLEKKYCSLRCSVTAKIKRRDEKHKARMAVDPEYAAKTREYKNKRNNKPQKYPIGKCKKCGVDIPRKWGVCDACLKARWSAERKKARIIKPPSRDKKYYRDAKEHFGACAYCGGAMEERDHFIPRSLGGKHRGNLVPSCKVCNAEKSGTHPLEWLVMREHGLLTFAKIQHYLQG